MGEHKLSYLLTYLLTYLLISQLTSISDDIEAVPPSASRWICPMAVTAPHTRNSLLRWIDARRSADCKVGSGSPRSVRTSVNITKVQELICSQEDAPGTHKSPREIEQITGIATVQRIAKKNNFFICYFFTFTRVKNLMFTFTFTQVMSHNTLNKSARRYYLL